MKFVIALFLVAFAAVAIADEEFCKAGTGNKPNAVYRNPESKKGFLGAWACMKYHSCKDGVDTEGSCFFLVPLRQYNAKSKQCDWFWNVDCDATD